MSLSAYIPDPPTVLSDMVKTMTDGGMTLVVAAGNNNADVKDYWPGLEPSVLTIAASDINDARAYFSNWGSGVDLFAPGLDIESCWIGNTNAKKIMSGTSQATPHVAGLVAYYIKLYKIPGFAAARMIKSTATTGKITDVQGSPNLLAYNNNGI
jgi:subtilisin family serine protease